MRMLELPSRTAFAALQKNVETVVPAVTLGFCRSLGETEVSVPYSIPLGFGEYILSQDGLPEVIQPWTTGFRQADAAALKANAERVFEWHLLVGNVQRVVSFRIEESEPATRFWIGLADSAPLTAEQQARLEAVAQASLGHLKTSVSPDDAPERLRRLELAAELLPALHVLDLREIFNRLSNIAQKALPHDLVVLRLLSEDLSKITTFARTGGGTDLDIALTNLYPPSVTRAWNFDVLDDLTQHSLERERP